MYNLYEHLEGSELRFMGEYESLPKCQKATEIRWDIMKQLGHTRAIFHCERAETGEHAVGWVY